MSDDRINELEHRSIETSQSETQREKKKENIEQSIQELWGHFKRSHLCMVLEYQKEKQEQGGKKIFEVNIGVMFLLSCSVLSGSLRPMDCSTPGFPVHHHLLEPAQTHVHWGGDAIKPSHPLSPPSPSAFNLSQHQGLFQWVSSSHRVTKVLELQPQHQSLQWIFRIDFL